MSIREVLDTVWAEGVAYGLSENDPKEYGSVAIVEAEAQIRKEVAEWLRGRKHPAEYLDEQHSFLFKAENATLEYAAQAIEKGEL